jgi:DNA-binding CsgD family transcriptional regulator
MSPPLKDPFERFHAEIGAARTIAECSASFLKVLKPHRIDTFACGEIDVAAKERAVFFAIEWPERFRSFYFSSGLLDRDPAVEGLSWYNSPFTWGELRADRRISPLGTEALDVIKANGWSDGVVVPIPRGGTRYGIVSVVAEAPAVIDTNAKSLIALLSVCFHERVRAMAPFEGFPVPPAGLSERERQCLNLVARGRSDREVGDELGIAASTAHEYTENAKRKLLASSRAEAVAVAISLGIIVI